MEQKMTRQEILDFLNKNKIDTYDACIVTSCDEDWEELASSRKKKVKALRDSGELTFETFCETAESLWLDFDDMGLTRVASMVRAYIEDNGELPGTIVDLEEYY